MAVGSNGYRPPWRSTRSRRYGFHHCAGRSDRGRLPFFRQTLGNRQSPSQKGRVSPPEYHESRIRYSVAPKYFVPILYRDPAFSAFDDFSDFLESISCETSEYCQVRGSNPCRDRPEPPVCRPEDSARPLATHFCCSPGGLASLSSCRPQKLADV